MTRSVAYPRCDGNVHLSGLREAFGPLRVAPGQLPDCQSIILLCFTNRTGSNYLAAGLASTGHVNAAREVFNVDFAREYPGQSSLASLLHAAIADQQVGGRYSLKVSIPHLEIMGEAGLFDLWRDRIRYVYIERADRLAQAISWEIATQSGQWHHRFPRRAEPVYDRARIVAALELFATFDRQFDLFFGMNGIVPERVIYEELDANPAQVVARVARAVGLPSERFEPSRIDLLRQADQRNAAWRARFLDGD